MMCFPNGLQKQRMIVHFWGTCYASFRLTII